MFEKFPSLTRFSHGWTVTEKLDGTNACINIVPFDVVDDENRTEYPPITAFDGTTSMYVYTQSRSKIISPGKGTDNHGFAQWVSDNAQALVETLGEGRHFGEWVGKGINKRGYNLDQKVFALFNTARWRDMNELDGRLRCVPVLAEGYMGEPGSEFERVLVDLQADGSVFAPGFMDPEGIVMRHGPSGTLFKKTFDYDEQGKWAENEARRQAAA
jgi:hypothetical protein